MPYLLWLYLLWLYLLWPYLRQARIAQHARHMKENHKDYQV